MSIVRDLDEIYAKDQRLKRQDVRILQEWLKKQEHLPELTELHVIVFLHSCYYSTEKTKVNIDSYFTRRTLYHYCFERLDEEELRVNSSVALITALPKTTPQGHSILLAKLVDYRPENFDFTKLTRLIDMVVSLYLRKHAPLEGAIVVYDTKGFSFSHLTRINFLVLKHATELLQEVTPVRMVGVHFINAMPLIDKLMGLVKPFVPNELYNLVHVHSSLDTFYKYVPRECLPEDYGGDLPSCQNLQEKNLANLLDNYDFFKRRDCLKVDESKRLGKSNTFGTDGTFKKLEVD